MEEVVLAEIAQDLEQELVHPESAVGRDEEMSDKSVLHTPLVGPRHGPGKITFGEVVFG